MKKFVVVFCSLLLMSCQSKLIKTQDRGQIPTKSVSQGQISQTNQVDQTQNQKELLPQSEGDSNLKAEPSTGMNVPVEAEIKIGLILGPGSLRSFAHIGIVTEFVKAKLPIHAVAGIEMGSLVAAIYANRAQPYDVEWQMMKMKEGDVLQKGLLSSSVKPGEMKSLNEFISVALSSAKAEDSKIRFLCPSFNTVKRQTTVITQGRFSDILMNCVPSWPLYKPFRNQMASSWSLKPIIDKMKQAGINFIVYVDLLAGNNRIDNSESETESLWSIQAASLSEDEKLVSEVVRIQLQNYTLIDFSRRREMINRGQLAGKQAAMKIKNRLGL